MKIIAPVCLHLVRRSVAGLTLERRQACRRKYSERVNFSRLARERINRASSSVTLKLIIFILYYSITHHLVTSNLPRKGDGAVEPDSF